MQHQQRYTKFHMIVVSSVLVIICTISDYNLAAAEQANQQTGTAAAVAGNQHVLSLVKRADDHHKHHAMVHSHLSRKVFDRACAASKDTVDEIIACITESETLTKAVKPEIAANCHKDAFGIDFDPKDITKHKEIICNNRDKFENMTACIYRKLAESLDPKEMDKMAEAMVDVGLCIINALDG